MRCRFPVLAAGCCGSSQYVHVENGTSKAVQVGLSVPSAGSVWSLPNSNDRYWFSLRPGASWDSSFLDNGIIREGLFVEMSDDDWSGVLATNLDGVYHTIAKSVNIGYASGEATIEGNVATFIPKEFMKSTDEDWETIYRVNVLSGVRLSRAYLPRMKQQDWGREAARQNVRRTCQSSA